MKRLVLSILAATWLVAAPAAQATQPVQPRPKPAPICECCRDLGDQFTNFTQVFNTYRTQNDQRVTNLEQRLSVVENQLQHTLNYINEVNLRISTVINRLDALTCRSNRIYSYHLRRDVGGDPVVGVVAVRALGTPERASFVRRADGRFRVTANYQGVEAPNGQWRTVMATVRLRSGRIVDLVQDLRLCLQRDGDPNDTPAQARAGV